MMTTRRKQKTATNSPAKTEQSRPALPTFLDHVRELQIRLFFVAVAFLLSSSIAYFFIDKIVNFIVSPLGKSVELVYLSPSGAFNFLIQACLYVGALGALPAIVYQVYRFTMPVMETVKLRRAVSFTVFSCLLAAGGVAFAYFVVLPAALYFLTSFNLYHINPMLTIDAYFSFVMTYLVVGAALFQLPLIMLVINSVHPLTPGGLMKIQPHIILGSFVVAAIVSPTPDVVNQTLLASPIVVMYQVGIVSAWVVNRSKPRSKLRKKVKSYQSNRISNPAPVVNERSQVIAPQSTIGATNRAKIPQRLPYTPSKVQAVTRKTRSIDGFSSRVRPQRPTYHNIRQERTKTPGAISLNTQTRQKSTRVQEGILLSQLTK